MFRAALLGMLLLLAVVIGGVGISITSAINRETAMIDLLDTTVGNLRR
jgi:hypothetical protein